MQPDIGGQHSGDDHERDAARRNDLANMGARCHNVACRAKALRRLKPGPTKLRPRLQACVGHALACPG